MRIPMPTWTGSTYKGMKTRKAQINKNTIGIPTDTYNRKKVSDLLLDIQWIKMNFVRPSVVHEPLSYTLMGRFISGFFHRK